jgi:peptidoglycan/LPS O-acetylase OafA/YrhL
MAALFMRSAKALNIFLIIMFLFLVALGCNIYITSFSSNNRMEFLFIYPFFICLIIGTITGAFVKARSLGLEKVDYASFLLAYGSFALFSGPYISSLLEWLGIVKIERLTGG